MHTDFSRCEFNMLMIQGWLSAHKNPKGKTKSARASGRSPALPARLLRAVMLEKPQVHRVWIPGVVTRSIQPPAEHVFVVYTSGVEGPAHPFPIRQLTGKGKISAVIPAAQTVLAPGQQQWGKDTINLQCPASWQTGESWWALTCRMGWHKSSHRAREPWPMAPTKGHDFLLAGYLLQADGRSNKVSHKRAGECVAVVLFTYL